MLSTASSIAIPLRTGETVVTAGATSTAESNTNNKNVGAMPVSERDSGLAGGEMIQIGGKGGPVVTLGSVFGHDPPVPAGLLGMEIEHKKHPI